MPYVPSKKSIPSREDRCVLDNQALVTAECIAEVSKKYNHSGAFAGELNYFITRLIQHLFRELVKTGEVTSELRYFMQAMTYGVLLDVVLEHKERVNKSYEIHQLLTNGDCYDAPFYSKPLEVINPDGSHVGYIYVNMKRSNETIKKDKLPNKIILSKTSS